MTPHRFAALAEAYGADIARWPAAEQSAARILASDPANAALLAQAQLLDHALNSVPAPLASRDLYDRIVAEAPHQAARGRMMRWLGALGLGAALATACASGVAVGAVFAPAGVLQRLQPQSEADPLQEASSLLGDTDTGNQSG
jgi:anti-sigma factor RsiW